MSPGPEMCGAGGLLCEARRVDTGGVDGTQADAVTGRRHDLGLSHQGHDP